MSKNFYHAILFLGVVVLTVSFITVWSQNDVSKGVDIGAVKMPVRPDPTPPGERGPAKRFSQRGVSFSYDQTLADEISAKIIDATPIHDPSGNPDGVLPRHLSLQFTGSYGDRSGYTPYPEINVFSIDAFIKMFRHTDYSGSLDEKFRTLRSALSKQPAGFDGEYPFIPYPAATQLVHSHLSYISFENGKGIGYITQFNHADEVLINNKRLVYVYQGLTSDGKYLVSTEFPLRASFLPEEPYKGSHLGYTMRSYRNREEWQAIQEEYKKYLPAAETELRSATDDQFTPNLADIKKLISSLACKPGGSN
jgi:hypothetical protein